MKKAAVVAACVVVAVLAIATLVLHLRARSAGGGSLRHARSDFEFVAHGPYDAVFPLFGANGERAWAGKSWNPQFVYGDTQRDAAGSVFTTPHGHLTTATWITTAFDSAAGHVQYAIFLRDEMVTLIDIHVSRRTQSETLVNVAYEHTALRADANDHVQHLSESERDAGKHWQAAIDEALNKPQPRP
jgi:hypothetical protein